MGTAWLEGQPDLPPLLPGSLLLFLKGRLISDLKLFDGLPGISSAVSMEFSFLQWDKNVSELFLTC